jgi:hypothetical protein
MGGAMACPRPVSHTRDTSEDVLDAPPMEFDIALPKRGKYVHIEIIES